MTTMTGSIARTAMLALGAFTWLSPGVASAQEPPPPPPAADSRTDHDKVVGHVGVGWFGISEVPIATGAPGGTTDDPVAVPGPNPATVSVPALGLRYWLSKTVGLDVAVGMSIASGSISSTVSSEDKQSVFAMLLHAGLPLALANGKHISLQLTPEMNFGFATSSVEPGPSALPPPNASLTGTRFDIGARIGGEIQFGFMDIPELALEGSVGAYFTHQQTTVSVGEASYTDANVLFTTTSFDNPWEIFTGLLAARYYF